MERRSCPSTQQDLEGHMGMPSTAGHPCRAPHWALLSLCTPKGGKLPPPPPASSLYTCEHSKSQLPAKPSSGIWEQVTYRIGNISLARAKQS